LGELIDVGGDAAALDASFSLVCFVVSGLALGLFALFQTEQKNNDDDDSSPGGGLMQPIS